MRGSIYKRGQTWTAQFTVGSVRRGRPVTRTTPRARRRKVTADGVELKASTWAKLLGTTADTVRGRYRRLDQGEPASAATPLPNQRARSWSPTCATTSR